MAKAPLFNKKSLDFLALAGKQKSPLWLDEHSEEFERLIVSPLKELSAHLIRGLAGSRETRGYKFPRRGFGRLRRPSHKVAPGQPAYRNWVQLQAARPSQSRFDDNPRLYFFASPGEIYAGGGLEEPSSRQIKSLRAWLADEPEELVDLLTSRSFKKVFPTGFETDRVLKTFPRFYPPDHPRIQWLRLQSFAVKRHYTKKEFTSAEFPDLLLENWCQTLRFNEQLFEGLKAWDQSLTPFVPTREEEPEESDEATERFELWDERL